MALEVRNLNYTYSFGTAYEIQAIHDMSFTIEDGQFVGLIGRTGSGKSTLIQHMNGLEKASSGDILWDGVSIYSKNYKLGELRQQVGLVFQYPEHQLFEETVLKDVCFGPKNMGLSQEACEARARKALAQTGVGEEFYDVSPFDLSGGQKRRVAIAGVLAMQPRMLILDEPTAGLDPDGRRSILNQLRKLHDELGITIVLVSHSMEDVAEYVERLMVLCDGTLLYDDTPGEVFRHYEELEKIGLAAPKVTYLMHALADCGLPVDAGITKVEEAVAQIHRILSGNSTPEFIK